MSSPGSESRCIAGIKAGNRLAFNKLYKRHFDRLARQARKKLKATPRRVADEEDVVQSVMRSLFSGAQKGKFPLLNDRDDLRRLLYVLISRKAINQIKHERAKKRGGGKVRGESGFERLNAAESNRGIDVAVGSDPGPATIAGWKENYQGLLDALDDELLQQIAICVVEGYTIQQIATMLGRSLSSINLKLKRIRKIWSGRR
jgi:RNA polymerase sigma factor (sigma-70 family)